MVDNVEDVNKHLDTSCQGTPSRPTAGKEDLYIGEGFMGVAERLNRLINKEGEDEWPQTESQTSPFLGSRNSPKRNSLRLYNKRRKNTQCVETSKQQVVAAVKAGTPDFDVLSGSSQEQVCELYQHLHASDNPELLEHFETIILGVIKDVRNYQVENQRLEKSFKREKVEHEKHLRHLEEEMEKEIQKMEEKMRIKEQEKVAAEKAELKKEVEDELVTLKHNLSIMQQEGCGAKNKELEDQLIGLKGKLDEIIVANRQLKSELTDSKTNLALVRSELVSVRQQYTDKCRELNVEKETVMDIVKEQDNLTRQLHLLHDANKQLHDTNDDLREVIVTRKSPLVPKIPSPMVLSRSSSNASVIPADRRGSVMSDYIQSGPPSARKSDDKGVKSLSLSRGTSIAEDQILEDEEEVLNTDLSPSPRLIRAGRLPREDTLEEDYPTFDRDDLDSGHSTLRDLNDIDSESEAPYEHIRTRGNRRPRRNKSGHVPYAEDADDDEPDSHDEMEDDGEPHLERDPRVYRYRDQSRLGVPNRSRGSSRSRNRDSGGDSSGGRRSLRKERMAKEEMTRPISREPERMYKIVLAGDAATGKSSFIMRLCKGKFVGNLSSTLGVDFQTKVLEVDGRTVALQLWDTAGQERFRSIAKSYFRRADGVFLLYDCTYERSFLNIRDWVESIKDGAQKNVPVMLCANKTDLREGMEKQGRKVVHYEDGQRLAREFEALFIETSAKDGSNVSESVIELTRLMRANEDLEVKTVGMQLTEGKSSEKGICCGK